MPDGPPADRTGIIRTELAKGESATGKFGLAADFRSVGELVTDADLIARQLLYDVDGQAAAQVLRTWPQLMEATADLIRTIPVGGAESTARLTSEDKERVREALTDVDPSRAGAAMLREVAEETGVALQAINYEMRGDVIATRLLSLTTSVASDVDGGRWPGPGETDDRMSEMVGNLDKARGLVERFAGNLDVTNGAVAGDLDATRTRALHLAYIATHAVGTHLRADREAEVDERGPDRPTVPVAGWLRKVESVEATLSREISERPLARAAERQHEPAPVGLPRLAAALERFGNEARRTLAADPIPAELGLVARAHGMFAGATLTLTEAGVTAGALEATSVQRMTMAVTSSGQAWMDLGERWRDLSPGDRPPRAGLLQAAGELRAACRELTHTRDQLASPETIAARADLGATAPTLAQAFEAGAGLAESSKTALVDAERLHGSPHTLEARALVETKALRRTHPELLLESFGITPDDKRRNLPVRAPAVVVDALRDSADRAARGSAAAAAAGHQVVVTGRPNGDLVRAQEAAHLGRAAQPRPAEEISKTSPPESAAAADPSKGNPGVGSRRARGNER